MKIFYFLLAVSLFCLNVSSEAQNRGLPFDVEYKYTEDKSFVIYVVNKNDFMPYTLVFHFTDVRNLYTEDVVAVPVISDGELFRFSPIDPEQECWAGYWYYFNYGWVNSDKIEKDFVYRMPCKEAKTCEVGNLWKNESDENWWGYSLVMEQGDDVYAMRKGVVIQRSVPGLETSAVTVQHPDGTLALYACIENGSITVNEGDTVYPYTVIGKAGTDKDGVSKVKINISYLWSDTLLTSAGRANDTKYISIRPFFSTSEGNIRLEPQQHYTPKIDDKLITAEMNRKEIKSYKSKK